MKLKREQVNQLSYSQKLDYYCHLNDMISVNNGNSKTGLGCLTMSMPPLTCREDAPCKKNCYCMKGRQVYASVRGAYYRNYRLWGENKERFEQQLDAILTFSGIGMFRYQDCGEIPDEDYLAMMFRVAVKHPEIIFLAYTKKYELINDYVSKGHAVPENLTIRFSMWDKGWEVPNPHGFPVAYVDFKDKSLNPDIPKNAFVCRGGDNTTCSCCKMCWKKQVKSVVFHQH